MEKVHKLVFMLISKINRNLFKEFSRAYVIFAALKTNSGFSIHSYIIMFPTGVLNTTVVVRSWYLLYTLVWVEKNG